MYFYLSVKNEMKCSVLTNCDGTVHTEEKNIIAHMLLVIVHGGFI